MTILCNHFGFRIIVLRIYLPIVGWNAYSSWISHCTVHFLLCALSQTLMSLQVLWHCILLQTLYPSSVLSLSAFFLLFPAACFHIAFLHAATSTVLLNLHIWRSVPLKDWFVLSAALQLVWNSSKLHSVPMHVSYISLFAFCTSEVPLHCPFWHIPSPTGLRFLLAILSRRLSKQYQLFHLRWWFLFFAIFRRFWIAQCLGT